MNEKKSKKMKREGLKEICNSNGDVSSKKPKISEEIANNEMSTIGQEYSEKKKLEVSKEISNEKEIGILQIDSGKKTSKNPKISEKIAKKEKFRSLEKISKIRKPKNSYGILKKEVDKNDNEGVDFAEKKYCMTRVLKDDSLNLITEERNCDANHENVRLPAGVEIGNVGLKVKTVFDSHNIKKGATETLNKNFAAHIQLPQGASLTTVAGIELNSEDVGHALQFLEFCAAFGKVCLSGALL